MRNPEPEDPAELHLDSWPTETEIKKQILKQGFKIPIDSYRLTVKHAIFQIYMLETRNGIIEILHDCQGKQHINK